MICNTAFLDAQDAFTPGSKNLKIATVLPSSTCEGALTQPKIIYPSFEATEGKATNYYQTHYTLATVVRWQR
jgi:hypothetical protein